MAGMGTLHGMQACLFLKIDTIWGNDKEAVEQILEPTAPDDSEPISRSLRILYKRGEN